MPAYSNLPKSILDPELPFGSGGKATPAPKIDEAYTAWKDNDTPKSRGQLLRVMQPTIDKGVKSYAGKNPGPAARSQAKLLAMQAFQTYDPNRGSMENHLLANLRRLQRTSAQSAQVISIPERVALDRQHLSQAEQQLQDELGRAPSDAEIADYTGLSLKRIGYVRGAHGATNTGSILDDAGMPYSPASHIPGDTSAADAWQDMVYHDLGRVDQAIMDYSLGLRGSPQLSTQQIAQRLGLSAGAISQRKAKIQAMLDERTTNNVFGGGA